MNALRRNHLLIAGLLFVSAIVLYALGMQYEALALFVLGAIVETGAWIALLADRSEGSFPYLRR